MTEVYITFNVIVRIKYWLLKVQRILMNRIFRYLPV